MRGRARIVLLAALGVAACHGHSHRQSRRVPPADSRPAGRSAAAANRAIRARDAAPRRTPTAARPAARPSPTGVARLPFDAHAVPASLAHTGQIVGGVHWRDDNGDNWLLLSRLVAIGADSRSVYLAADHYAIAGGAPRLLREVRDHLDRCQLDLTARFLPASLSVTDLDGDGVGEVTFAYQLGCRSDVSPITLKLLTLENGDRYILRGKTRVASDHAGGSYTVDASFTRGPKQFLAHARTAWAAIVHE